MSKRGGWQGESKDDSEDVKKEGIRMRHRLAE